MWDEYGLSAESVAIRSSIGRLADSVRVPSDPLYSHLGAVEYIEHNSHEISSYEAAQAIERAFLKDAAHFSHEREIRIVTMNWKTTACVSPEGVPYQASDVADAKMNNFENAGLYVGVDLGRLVAEIIVHPNAESWFGNLVAHVAKLSALSCPILPSGLARNA